MAYHGHLFKQVSNALSLKATCYDSGAAQIWEEAKEYLLAQEINVHPVFDIDLFINMMGGVFR